MTDSPNTTGLAGWLRQATNIPILYRLNIRRHLVLCFVFLILMMVICDGVLLWQLRQVRSQVELLKGVDAELIEVLRVHGDLFSFYTKLGFAARSEDRDQLMIVSEELRSGVLEEAKRTEAAFSHLPPEVKVDETIFPTIETIENTLPSHLDAIKTLAASGEWAAVRDRTDKQIQRLEFVTSQLVKEVARSVEEKRTQAASNIAVVERRIVFATVVTGFVTLFTAVFFGWATAQRIMMDMTERKRSEEALREAQANLARVSRVTTMGELTASLAHEIKQPIAAAVTNARTCLRWLGRDQPDVAEGREAAARIIKDVTRASDIISSISVMFKKGALQRQAVDVNELIREMIVLLRSEASRYSISIRAELAEHLPKVMADRVQLQQVFMNLMLNGIDAMKELTGRGELTIKSETGDGHLLISVSDTGVGLAPEQAEQVFKAFFTTKDSGTGMGLPISRSIIESHGGRLWANGNSICGATFCFTMPTSVETTNDAGRPA
jgi:C4-dicarboxylate-specific signal transduction histidine kinase